MSTVLAFERPKRNSPSIENGKVAPPRRVANLERRSREHLTPAEVERLIVAAAKEGRHGLRDATLVLIAYRHGLRVGELVSLRWEQVDLARGTLHVNRTKNGEAATQPAIRTRVASATPAQARLSRVAVLVRYGTRRTDNGGDGTKDRRTRRRAS